MRQLEAELKRLESEYNMFFAGRLPRLPWETRARVEAMVKRYDRLTTTNTAQKFRFGTLQSRFVAFCELWERTLLAKETGRVPGQRAKAQPPADPAKEQAKPEPARSAERLVHVASFRDPAQEMDRLKELYERLSEARAQAGEAQIPFHRFTEVVRAQVKKVGDDGKSDVSFRVAMKEGKVTLTVKPVKGEE